MLFEFRGFDGQVELYENKIVIRRKGFARITREFNTGDKEIYIKSLSSIQVKKPGAMPGYIQFVFSGSREVNSSDRKKISKDENTVMFRGDNNYQDALKLKAKIEKLMYEPTHIPTQVVYQTTQQPSSTADELIKYKSLLDQGAITEDEYIDAKRKLLGADKTLLENNDDSRNSSAANEIASGKSHISEEKSVIHESRLINKQAKPESIRKPIPQPAYKVKQNEIAQALTNESENVTNNFVTQKNEKESPKNIRKSMAIWAGVCLLFGVIYIALGISSDSLGMSIGMFGFCLILAIMFFVLAKSPKEKACILGKDSGIKKTKFVILCIVVSIVVAGVAGATSGNTPSSQQGVPSPTPQASNYSTVPTEESAASPTIHPTSQATMKPTVEPTIQPTEEIDIVLSDVENWYNAQMPFVSQSLIEYSKSVDGISNVNITQSEFRFGEDSGWYDCHYTIYFNCKVDGKPCTGEARGFMEYEDTTLNWFHFEIFRNSDWATIVEHYDDSYDKIIEDYYNELKKQYGR